jgi:hypothetical protein
MRSDAEHDKASKEDSVPKNDKWEPFASLVRQVGHDKTKTESRSPRRY